MCRMGADDRDCVSPLAAPSGFTAWEDVNDGYAFNFPFGWQEVSIQGADVVFKDVVEPLESVSLTMVKTDKNDISEYGSLQEVRARVAVAVCVCVCVKSAVDACMHACVCRPVVSQSHGYQGPFRAAAKYVHVGVS